jgi:hypothetical protein
MQDSKFWRAVAIVICGGILYVGHGLHSGGSDGVPPLVNTARAGGVATAAPGAFQYVYTASTDGRILYLWRTDGDGRARFAGSASISDGVARPKGHLTSPAEGNRPPFLWDGRDAKPPAAPRDPKER